MTLSLSLAPVLAAQIYRVDKVANVVNYRADSVRFPAAVPVGSRIRETVTIEVADRTKPACVANVIYQMSPE